MNDGTFRKRLFWQEMLPIVLTVSVMVIGGAVPANAISNDQVELGDSRLRACVADALGADPSSAVTTGQLASLTGTLSCPRLAGEAVADIEPLRNATSLTGLDLQGNEIQDLSPLAGLANLHFLNLAMNNVTDVSPLAGLVNLETLDLESNDANGVKITDVSPLAALVNLRVLKVNVAEITDISPLSGLHRLAHVEMFDNRITDLSPLAELTELYTLYIGLNPFTDVSPLGGLLHLNDLFLGNAQITDVSPLARLTGLTTLHLYGNQIADISPLESLTGLTTLSLEEQHLAAQSTARNTATAIPSLKGADGNDVPVSVISGNATVEGNTVTWASAGTGVLSWSAPTAIGSAAATFSGEVSYEVADLLNIITQDPGEGINPQFETASLANGQVGTPYTAKIKVGGVDTPLLSLSNGALPGGLKLDAKTGIISGTPVAPGAFTFEAAANNNVGTASKTYTITINAEHRRTCDVPRQTSVFVDTPTTHRFYTEIDWLYCKGVTTGIQTGAGLAFDPKLPLTREAMAAFMFRLEAPKDYSAPIESPFADVKTSDKFYREIAWMWDRGLSTGSEQHAGKPFYAPKQALTREAMAAFLYRLKSPSTYQAPTESQFADVSPGTKFYTEISWMYEQKITTGNSVGSTREYWPKNTLTREVMAAFIYRFAHTPVGAEHPLVTFSQATESKQAIKLSTRMGFTVSLNPLGDTSLKNVQRLTRASYTQPAHGEVLLGLDDEILVKIPSSSDTNLTFEVTVLGQDHHKETLTYLIDVTS